MLNNTPLPFVFVLFCPACSVAKRSGERGAVDPLEESGYTTDQAGTPTRDSQWLREVSLLGAGSPEAREPAWVGQGLVGRVAVGEIGSFFPIDMCIHTCTQRSF